VDETMAISLVSNLAQVQTRGASSGGVSADTEQRAEQRNQSTQRRFSGAGDAAEGASAARGRPMLEVGSSGPAVEELKAELRAQKYWVDKGSTFTNATRDAVMAFQKVNRIDRDGEVGPQTWGALDNPIRPSIGSGENDRVVIDLSDQVLYLVDDGQLKKTVNTSTGDPNSPDGQGIATPQGTFRVYEKRAGTDPGPLGNLYWSSYFNGGVAVHGSPSVPPYPASHGCARVPMWLDEKLWEKMPVGMQVKVRK
jgi:N-acetylmuramoyl-L-alanine amidase